MRYICCVLTVVLGLIPSNSQAEFSYSKTVQDLYNACKGPGSQSFCIGYIMASYDALEVMGEVGAQTDGGSKLGICNDPKISYGAIKQVFIRWAEKNPQNWTMHQFAGLMTMFMEIWPCH